MGALALAPAFGDPRMPDRFWMKTKSDESGCWLWQGAISPKGYSRVWFDGKIVFGHRWIYESLVGIIPEGLQIDHLCRVRRCVNPQHLEPVTCRENLLRSATTLTAMNAAKTRCPRSHPYDEINTGYQKSGRYCLTCSRIRKRLKRKAAQS